jgi:UDP-N-acetylglucosamine acyltransferase
VKIDDALIHPSAKIAAGVTIGPGCIIGEKVTIAGNVTIGAYAVIGSADGASVHIDEGTWIGPHAVIQGPTTIGKNNKIFQFTSIGDTPQDVTYQGELTQLIIGDDNIIREYCMISRATSKGEGITRIGDHNFLMAYTHVGHDCTVGNHVIMVSYSGIAGHVIVDDYAIIGPYAGIHQFCRVGTSAFVARASYITKDVLPYLMVSVASTCGINTVGLRRRGFSSTTIDQLRRAYKVIFRRGLTVQQALAELEVMQQDCPEIIPMIDIMNQSTRGIVR